MIKLYIQLTWDRIQKYRLRNIPETKYADSEGNTYKIACGHYPMVLRGSDFCGKCCKHCASINYFKHTLRCRKDVDKDMKGRN